MSRIDLELTARFREWEERTRGRLVYPHPVSPEPPFVPFPGHHIRATDQVDDGLRPTVVSTLFRNLWSSPTPKGAEDPPEDPAPGLLERGSLIEFPLYLPEAFKTQEVEFDAFIRSLFVCQEPIAFELVGSSTHVTAQLAAGAQDSAHVNQQLRAFFPELVATPTTGGLEKAWQKGGDVGGVVEFGLARESVCLLANPAHDTFVGLVGVMSELAADECAVFQVIWQSVENKWAENLVRAVTHANGEPFFVNAPELAGFAKAKTARPLYAAVVRLAACSADFDRSWEILRLLAGGLGSFANPIGNELVPLRNDDYPFEAHIEDVIRRQSRRAGMILNADELLGLVHLPSSAVRSSKFRRQLRRTKPAPAITAHVKGLLLGENEHAGEVRQVSLDRDQRHRHMHVIGASGTGKTTLLFNLIRQDIESGAGLAVFDPHGDLIDRILGCIPPSRIADVVLLDPGDEDFSVGFNILSAHSELEKNLLASDLVSVFQRLSTSWGDQMGVVLSNAIRAFLDSDRGGTLADLRRFLLEPAFRNKFLQTVRDPDIVYYWRMGFTQLSGNKSIGSVMTRLETFLGPKPIRYMVSQEENRLDFGQILDGGKIFLAKLSQGAIGKENSFLLGSLLMAKFQQIAMGRQSQQEADRRDFWLYLDEFHNFITPSTAEILTGARKYHVGLVLAHHELRQLQRDSEVASAVLANPYTRICFRVGDQDARVLEHGFSAFEARDLQNLSPGDAVCRVERSDFDFNLRTTLPEYPDESSARERREAVIAASRAKYATPRAEVEARLRERTISDTPDPSKDESLPKPRRAKPTPPPASSPTPELEAAAGPTTKIEPPVLVPTEPPPEPAVVSPPADAKPIPVTEPVIKSTPTVIQTPVPVSQLPQERIRPEEKPAPSPADMGRGGAQHQAIQLRLKEAASSLGFRVFIEKPILDGSRSVDLVFERETQILACEITVTTTVDHEIGNVSKCLKAGFTEIAVVAVTDEKLEKMTSAVRHSLGEVAASRVKFFLPEAFIDYLRGLAPPVRAEPKTKTVRGYKVKTVYEDASPEDIKAKEAEMVQLMADLMQKKAASKRGQRS